MYYIYCKNGNLYAEQVVNKQQHLELLNRPEHVENVAKVRAGDKSRKNPLWITMFNFNILPNADGTIKDSPHRANTCFIEFDEEQLAAAGVTAQKVVDRFELLAEFYGILLVSFSLSRNVHAVFQRIETLNQRENLDRIIIALGFPGLTYDPKCAENTSMGTFEALEEDIVYLDERLYEVKEVPNLDLEKEKETMVRKTREGDTAVSRLDLEPEQPTAESHYAWNQCTTAAGLTPGQVDVDHQIGRAHV